ncbi:MAG TPA: carbohydrate-binding family V/XII, partial [Burkholderiales bacterium]|nr:carbohydrate-binding family V/XII [Burkholderiales bacterium]
MKPSAGCAAAVAALVLACWLAPSRAEMQPADEPAATAGPAAAAASGVTPSFPWPYQFSDGGVAFTVYPPQLERWQTERIEGQAAVAAQAAGADKPVFGVVSLSARTETDTNGMVRVRDISVSRASFPTAGADSRGYLDAVRRHLASLTWTVARDRLESELAIEHASHEAQGQPLRNAPPRIYYSESPAILVPVDGPPQLKELAGFDLSRVINTRALILQDRSSRRYYLFVAGHWMEAPAIEGPWSEAQVRPSVLEEAKEQVQAAGQVDLVEGSESSHPPEVFVATGPAELVQTDGPPEYQPIPKTNLLYVTNTPNRLFLDVQTQKYYVLLAGRWYRAASLTRGPWEYVAGTSLPPDFALIPDNHPAEGVRASVAGTAQAQEAVIANGVPQMATVKRSAATLEITYDGAPQFRSIEGTPLQYAVNAPMPVIQVDASSFYALDNGVWFVAPSAFGAWSAAT